MYRVSALFLLVVLLSGCGGNATGESGQAGAIDVEDAWSRATPETAEAGAVYMTISGGEDRLVGASVDPSVAGSVELHETVAVEGQSESGMEGAGEGGVEGMEDMGMLEMREVESIDVPADGEVVLEPGGLHVMLLELAEPLEEGDTFDVLLQFERAGELTVPVEVRES